MGIDVTPPSKSPEDSTEADTPPPIKLFTNGAFKPRPPGSVPAPAYKECMKNHAASLGGHAVDGCGEFMPSPSATVADPTSLKCAACGCHRNFHRREPSSPTAAITPPFLDFRRPGPMKRFSLSPSPPPPPLAAAAAPISYAPHALFGVEHQAAPVTPTAENITGGRKRFRTKFSQEQKEQMHSFSERLGWRMQKSDTAGVEEFCRQVGVSRGVLKVWMHNNKNTLGKKEGSGGGGRSAEDGESNGGKSSENKTINNSGSHFQSNPENNSNGVHFQISSNNSSNSSP